MKKDFLSIISAVILLKVLYVLVLSFSSLFILFLLNKLSGNREISNMSMFDYVASISIGSIAAEMSTNLDGDWWASFCALVIYGIITFLISVLTNKSLKFRAIVQGKPEVLFRNGKFYRESFKRTRLDLTEFLSLCRNAGYFSLDDMSLVLFETNGKLSILPASAQKPVTPADLKIPVGAPNRTTDIILDGKILDGALENVNMSESEFLSQMRAMGIKRVKDVFYAGVDSGGQARFYGK